MYIKFENTFGIGTVCYIHAQKVQLWVWMDRNHKIDHLENNMKIRQNNIHVHLL